MAHDERPPLRPGVTEISASEISERYRAHPITQQLLGPCVVCGLPFQDDAGLRVQHVGHTFHKSLRSVAPVPGKYRDDERSRQPQSRFLELAEEHDMRTAQESIDANERAAELDKALTEAVFGRGEEVDYHVPMFGADA